MARKLMRGVLLCFTSLAMLPGCRHLAPGTREITEDAWVRQELIAQKDAASRQLAHHVPQRKGYVVADETPPGDQRQNAIPTPPTQIEPVAETLPDPPIEFLESKVGASKGKRHDVELTGFAVGEPKTPMDRRLPPVSVLDQKSGKRLVAALQDLLDERQPDAIRHLEAYDKDTQEVLLRVLPILTIFAKKRFDELNATDIAMINEQFLGVLARLRPRSELGISRMCCCKKVAGFGNWESLPDNHAFLAGSPDRLGELVQLYVELKNFGSERTPDLAYLTKLACTLELRDAVKGEVVWSHTYDRKVTTHRRQTRINDFFSNFSFYVPPVAPGAYQLTIHIADESHPEWRREVRKSLDFRVTPVAGQPPLR